jgi:hypothetical protein
MFFFSNIFDPKRDGHLKSEVFSMVMFKMNETML